MKKAAGKGSLYQTRWIGKLVFNQRLRQLLIITSG